MKYLFCHCRSCELHGTFMTRHTEYIFKNYIQYSWKIAERFQAFMASPTETNSDSDVTPVARETLNFDDDTLIGENKRDEVNTKDLKKMGISSGTSTGWLFVHCVQIEIEFRNVGEGKTGVPGEKPIGARTRTNNKLNPHMTPSPGIDPGQHWREASALTTAPSLLPIC